MGKYDDVTSRLPKLIEDPSYQERVDRLKGEITQRLSLTPAGLAQEFIGLRIQKERIEEELSGVNLELKAVEQLLSDAYEAAGVTAVKLDDGSTATRQLEPCTQVTDDVAFGQWCRETGLDHLLKLPYQTANALVKDRLLRGEPEPPGVATYVRTKIVWRKG